MKICVITPLFEPWSLGGAEIYAEILTRELSRENDVVVITTKGPQKRKIEEHTKNPRVVEFTPKNIMTVYNFVTSQKNNFLKNTVWRINDLWNYSSYQTIKKILKKENPDIVHINGIRGFSPTVFKAIKNLKIPHVYFLHDYSLISPWSSLFRNNKPISTFNIFDKMYIYYLRMMSSKIDSVISPSKFVMEKHTRLGYFKKSKKFIIPHGCDLNYENNSKTKNEKNFLYIGQLLEGKGILIAVKAFQQIEDKDARFHIIGKGPLENKIKIEIKNDNRIILHGYVQHKKINSIIEKCSFLIVPSLWPEPFGLVINEGMRKGLPVIASDIGGIPELIQQNYNGFLFKAGDIDSLKNILKKLVSDQHDYVLLSSNAVKSSKKFSIETQMKSLLEVYNKSLSNIM